MARPTCSSFPDAREHYQRSSPGQPQDQDPQGLEKAAHAQGSQRYASTEG